MSAYYTSLNKREPNPREAETSDNYPHKVRFKTFAVAAITRSKGLPVKFSGKSLAALAIGHAWTGFQTFRRHRAEIARLTLWLNAE